MGGLTIGQVARQAGVHLETVRYYERRGLLPAPPRTAAGYRQYPPDVVRRVRFIKRAQGLGFTLDEIGGLLALRVHANRGCRGVEREAREVMARIGGQMVELEAIRTVLGRLVRACQQRQPTDDCPILEALEGAGEEG
jgi:Hg(II)-responsive transcriptional regulator